MAKNDKVSTVSPTVVETITETAPEAAPAAPAPVMVAIRCTSDKKPWTHERALELDEIAEVPESIAAILIANGFAEKVTV